MSYCRVPSMIYPTKTGVKFDLEEISDDDIDIFLYKIFLTRQKELAQRIRHGKEIIINWEEDCADNNNYKNWLLSQENKLFKTIENIK